LKAQVFDSSRSVTANIAEGIWKISLPGKYSVCRQSRGSLDETLEHMVTAYDDKYITKEILVILIKIIRMPETVK